MRLITDGSARGRRPPWWSLHQRGCGGDEERIGRSLRKPLPGNRTQTPAQAAGPAGAGRHQHPALLLPGPAASALLPWTWTLPSGWQSETETVMLQAEALEELFERVTPGRKLSFYRPGGQLRGQRDDTVLQELVLELYLFSAAHRSLRMAEKVARGLDCPKGPLWTSCPGAAP